MARKTDEILKDLEKGVADVFKNENFIAYLDTVSRFHHYSFNNCVLIAMQKPEASKVAGFNQWKNDFNRKVKKGEKAIYIIAPLMKKEETEGGQEKMILRGFRTVPVFDISQTEGDPLKTYEFAALTGNVEKYESFKSALEKVAAIPVIYEEKLKTPGAQGYYDRMEKEIHILSTLDEKPTLDVLIHETAHSRLHEKTNKDRQTKEVEAQAVSYVVAKHFGIDTDQSSFEYVASWSSGKELSELKASLDTIRKEADSLITEIEAQGIGA